MIVPLVILIVSTLTKREFTTIFNFNGNSYYFSLAKEHGFNIKLHCQDTGHLVVAIHNDRENAAIASLLKRNRLSGLFQPKDHAHYSLRTPFLYNKSIYVNYGPNTSLASFGYSRILSANGKWDIMSPLVREHYICQNEIISAHGINISGNHTLNIKHDHLLGFGNHSYYIYDFGRDFYTTERICHELGGYVFIPDYSKENCAIFSRGFSYIGIYYKNGHFFTVNGSNATFLPWRPHNHTNQTCISRGGVYGDFVGQDCNLPNNIICEVDSTVPGAIMAVCIPKRTKNKPPNISKKTFDFTYLGIFLGYGIFVSMLAIIALAKFRWNLPWIHLF